MKYQVGDIVLLLHSNEEGEVVDIINDKMVLVDVDGVRFPVYNDQIEYPYFKRFTEKKNIPAKKKKIYIDDVKKEKTVEKNKEHTGVWLSLLPVFDKDIFDDDVVEKIKVYLLNQTSTSFNFTYNLLFRGQSGFELNNVIEPFTDFYLHDIPFEEMNDAPRFEFDFSLVNADKTKASHFETTFKIKAKQLFQKIEEMRLKNEPAFSYLLFENYPDKKDDILPEYSGDVRSYHISEIRSRLEPPRSVIDLHIEKLTDEWRGLGNFEILTIQLTTFEKYYELAVAHRQPNLIVIHGVGKGKLRDEIHEILKTKKEVRTFANQYHPDFGFGATEIFFQY
jgi:hypothetical protein